MDNITNSDNVNISVKQPKRILHFSDGTLEEYSDSEDNDQQGPEEMQSVVDTGKLGWGPWIFHYVLRTGRVTLSACDYVGETLASFLGITTPKYQYELDEYQRMEKEKAMAEQNPDNVKGWLNTSTTNENCIINENNIQLQDTMSSSSNNDHL